MRLSIRMIVCAVGITAALTVPASAADRDWNGVGKALGKAGAMQPGGVYKIALPRTDLHVNLDGLALKPGFALGGWLAFEPVGDSTMVMGDLVLTQREIAPVMKKLEEDGIQITALHNHLLRAEPVTMYMHVLGHGDPIKLARALHDGLALSATPLGAQPGAAPPQGSRLDKAAIDRTLRAAGKENGGVLQYSFPRADKVEDAGMPVPPAMGSAIGINFQPTGAGKAAITGDFVLTAQEVNPVAKALREDEIEVTAIHNHMLQDQPRLFFLHFWANDEAQKLAKGLRTALDAVDIQKSRQ